MTASGGSGERIELPDGGVVEMTTQSRRIKDGVQDNTEPDGEDRTGFFPISPGKKTVVVRLPEDGQDMSHFYLHVDAQPLTRNVDFAGRPGPARPSFRVHNVCYAKVEEGVQGWTCIHPDGAGEGALKQRPATYVPVLTPAYNKEDSEAARAEAPIYDWYYRPEMQFSLFSLDMQQVNLKNSDGSTRNILASDNAASSYSADQMLRTLYRLEGTTTPSLTRIGGSRQLAFSLGDQLVNATLSNACPAGQTCAASSFQLSTRDAEKKLSSTDLLALRLLQKGDEANVLWEYGFYRLRIQLKDKQGAPLTKIPVGDVSYTNVTLQPENPTKAQEFTWHILKRSRGVIAEMAETTGKITVAKESDDGYIDIEARADENLFTQARVRVGCDCKACSKTGTCDARVGSVDLTFNPRYWPGWIVDR